ncbi:MAG TPA: gamma carbonic anhydrase family protein [Candidatus Binatia bacterium]|nr:gamma carbonic anhydrase family protein [Candidatus Binatia bacterium]
MLIEHQGRRPRVASSAYVAPTAVVCGDVTIGEDSRILFNAVVTADGGPVEIGSRCVVMEHALVRGRAGHPTRLGDNVLVGPHAHVNGARVEDNAFLATGAAVFPGTRIGARAEVRIRGVVHVNTALPADATVPIGWVAVGDPAQLFPPAAHEEIWAVQEGLDFPGTVFGLPRPPAGETLMPDAMARYAERFGGHRSDRIVHQERED